MELGTREHGFGRVHDAISCPSTSFITADEDAIMSIYTNTGVVKPTKAWSELQFEAVRVWNVLVTVVTYELLRVHVEFYELVRVPVRVFGQNLLTRAVESTRGHLDELSVQYVLRVLYILALRAPSRVLFSFHSTRPHPFFFFSSDIFIYSRRSGATTPRTRNESGGRRATCCYQKRNKQI